jgi:heme-degrading monooxygenase HmoA
MSYMRMARYSSPTDPGALRERVDGELIPLYQEQPGLESFNVAMDGEHIISVSIWDSEQHASAGGRAARAWADGYDDISAPDVAHVGEVLGSA